MIRAYTQHLSLRRNIAGLTIALSLGLSVGCGIDPWLPNNNDPSVVVDEPSTEPNDTFAQTVEVAFDTVKEVRLQGSISHSGDMDVFLLGGLPAGARITIDADTTDSSLDVSIAIFDADERLVYNNDDRGGTSTRFLDSYIDWVTRRASQYYLVVTNSAFAAANRLTGDYVVDVVLSDGFDVPDPAGQILMLDFAGAVVDSPTLGRMTLDPFDAAAISPFYQGETETIKETIRAVFEQNFERFDVTIVTTDDPPPPNGTLYSTIYFGGFDYDAFGIAEAVDLYNADFCDDAVIFTESFETNVFIAIPTAVEMGIAIGNVGSHEAGHLLGLNHVDDDDALMDDQSAADAFIEDQEFMEAPLSPDIMSIGTQDAVLLLDEIVGPSATGAYRLTGAAFKSRHYRSGR